MNWTGAVCWLALLAVLACSPVVVPPESDAPEISWVADTATQVEAIVDLGGVDEATAQCAVESGDYDGGSDAEPFADAEVSATADGLDAAETVTEVADADTILDTFDGEMANTEAVDGNGVEVGGEVDGIDSGPEGPPGEGAEIEASDGGPDTVEVPDAAEVDVVPFVWPTPPLANPILAPGLPNCATQAALATQLDAANCATVTQAQLFAAGACSGKPGFVYVLGGEAYPPQIDFDGEKSATPLRLDLATGQWASLPPMPVVRLSPKSVWLPKGLTVFDGLQFSYNNPAKWPGKYQAICADPPCLEETMQYTSMGWSTTPKQIDVGSTVYGSAVRIGCDILATQFWTIRRYSGTTFEFNAELPLAAQYALDSEQAIVPWGDWFALVTAPYWQAPNKTVPVLLLGKNGEKLAATLPPLPCPARFPIAWTNGEHLFVSDWGAVEDKDWQSKGCPGETLVPGLGSSQSILRWAGTHWTKAPAAIVGTGPAAIVDTPVGAIAVTTALYKGKYLGNGMAPYTGVMVQDKKTFIWKDDVYPPMPHGKIGATAVWAPK